MDIVVWLRSLGLGRYEAAFRENDIDETVLSSLTHETLKDLGVTSVGHRLKLLEPISKSSEEDNEAGELDKTEEVLSVVLPADEDATLPLYPGEEALDEPASRVTA